MPSTAELPAGDASKLGRTTITAGYMDDPASADLARSAVRGGTFTLAAQGMKVVVQLVAISALSRLLHPEDFGLIAMAAAVVGFVELFKDLGLSLATVQHPRITQDQVSTLFWINAISGLVLAMLTAAIAPLVARWYGEPKLIAITVALATTLALGGLTVQHQALIRRRMAFGILALIDVGSQAIGVGAAIGVATAGGGYWALVLQPIAAGSVAALGLLLLGGWMPSRRVCWAETRPLLVFGANMAGCNVLSYLSKTLDNVLIGRRWGPSQLGTYSRAYGILMLPITQINGPIAAVAIPVLSRLRHDPEAYSAQYLRLVRFMLALTTPACFIMAIFAPEIVRVLLGGSWADAGQILRVLSVASLVLPVLYAGGWLFASMGRTRQYLVVWVFVASALLGAFVAGLPRGAVGVARAYAMTMWLLIAPFLAVAIRGTGIKPWRLLGTIAAPLIACLTGSGVVLLVDGTLPGRAGPLLRLVLGGLILAASGLLSLPVSPGGIARFRGGSRVLAFLQLRPRP